MKKITGDQLKEILRLHKLWLRNDPSGIRADLSFTDLTYANLTRANLTHAKLTGANLAHANLTHADLTRADLTGAKLTGAKLTRVILTHADLTGADLDFSSWPLWCGSLKIGKTSDKLVCQLLYHALRAAIASDGKLSKKLLGIKSVRGIANKFHRAGECGTIEAAISAAKGGEE